jgi:hypothetical protein
LLQCLWCDRPSVLHVRKAKFQLTLTPQAISLGPHVISNHLLPSLTHSILSVNNPPKSHLYIPFQLHIPTATTSLNAFIMSIQDRAQHSISQLDKEVCPDCLVSSIVNPIKTIALPLFRLAGMLTLPLSSSPSTLLSPTSRSRPACQRSTLSLAWELFTFS